MQLLRERCSPKNQSRSQVDERGKDLMQIFRSPSMHIVRNLIFLVLLVSIGVIAHAQSDITESKSVPLSSLFYNLDRHVVGTFTHNYGINHLLAVSATYGIVQSGLDWKLHTLARKNRAIAYAGFSSVIVGGLTPFAVPLGMYLSGRSQSNHDLQLAGIALGQAALISLIVSSSYKTISGRRPPEILEESSTEYDFSKDFKFGFMNRGVFDGWPSGHTMAAFAMATTLIELYPKNESLKFYALLYASLVGMGVSVNIHWFSDAVAGALIGYSIGKTVGRGFRKLRNQSEEDAPYNITITPGGITISYRF